MLAVGADGVGLIVAFAVVGFHWFSPQWPIATMHNDIRPRRHGVKGNRTDWAIIFMALAISMC
jgi:hypothetical protein